MGDMASNTVSGRSAGRRPVERLLADIGYPERISNDSGSFTLRVDGAEVNAEEMNGRIVLSYALSGDERLLPPLATYAAGRMLKEDAVLAFGDGKAILWQEASADSDSIGLRRLFETFMDSCDWWRARVDALREGEAEPESKPETMMIRP